MKRPPAFQMYAKDWLSSKKISMMTLEQEGAYIRLLNQCWDSDDCTLPDDDEQLAVLSRAGERWLQGTFDIVKLCFTPHATKPTRLINSRLYAEWKKRKAFIRKCQDAGHKSAKQRVNQNKTQGKVGSTNLPRSVIGSFQPPTNSSIFNLQSSSSSIKKPSLSPLKSGGDEDTKNGNPECDMRVPPEDVKIILQRILPSFGLPAGEVDLSSREDDLT